MSRLGVAAVLAALLAVPQGVLANSTGIWNLARPEKGGCNCHGLSDVFPSGAYPPLPILDVDGLPEAYEPGEPYELTVAVIGPIVPFAGFNLEVTGGRLAALAAELPEGGFALVGFRRDECQALVSANHCDDPADCWVSLSDDCTVFGPDALGCACAPGDVGDDVACRPCDPETTVSHQATHAERATIPVWRLRWTAPACGFGPARFHLIGNSVNGAEADPGDVWGVLPEPIVVPEGASEACDP